MNYSTNTTADELTAICKPIPQPDDVSLPFFEAARQHILIIQRCRDCRTFQVPGRYVCDECLSEDLEWVEASGRGTVYAYVVMHQKYHPAFVHEIPYNVVVIELDEGPRILSNLVEVENSEISVGMPVSVALRGLD